MMVACKIKECKNNFCGRCDNSILIMDEKGRCPWGSKEEEIALKSLREDKESVINEDIEDLDDFEFPTEEEIERIKRAVIKAGMGKNIEQSILIALEFLYNPYKVCDKCPFSSMSC